MSKLKLKRMALWTALLTGIVLFVPLSAYCQDSYQIPEGVYIRLTKDFYDALKNQGSKVYSNDPSDEYLKQIAISTKFMVETNLEILKQQEKMNLMLDLLLKDKKK